MLQIPLRTVGGYKNAIKIMKIARKDMDLTFWCLPGKMANV